VSAREQDQIANFLKFLGSFGFGKIVATASPLQIANSEPLRIYVLVVSDIHLFCH
jgi:hypothetical protein